MSDTRIAELRTSAVLPPATARLRGILAATMSGAAIDQLLCEVSAEQCSELEQLRTKIAWLTESHSDALDLAIKLSDQRDHLDELHQSAEQHVGELLGLDKPAVGLGAADAAWENRAISHALEIEGWEGAHTLPRRLAAATAPSASEATVPGSTGGAGGA